MPSTQGAARVLRDVPKLAASTLSSLPTNISVPTYSKASLTPGILHFGPGNFHRAHQAQHLHRLFEKNLCNDWAITCATVMPSDQPLYEALQRQDMLYSLVEQSAEHSQATVIGSLHSYIPPADFRQILATLSQEHIHIVSLTITEGGYFMNEKTGVFDSSHQDIVADTTSDPPKTVFGLIIAGLRVRREAGIPPFTVMSCDNVPHNGSVAREAVVCMARLMDPELADWIAANVDFPNSMVDRITPVTGDRERQGIRGDWGVADDAPVFCESFLQWVLEDKFSDGRPQLEEVGVQFVDDVAPFETMKIRILNGGHATIAYPAGLLDIEFAHAAMADVQIREFLRKVEKDEIVPVVPPVPGTNLWGYLDEICVRFANPAIRDTVRRLCLDGSNRQPKFIIPSIRDRVSKEASVEGLALVSALWCRYCYGTTESGIEIQPNDPNWDTLVPVAHAAKEEPLKWLQQESLYGSLGKNVEFASSFTRWLKMIWEKGTRASLSAYMNAK